MSNGVVRIDNNRDWGAQFTPPLPLYPTDALPGSEEKIRVMRQRHSMGYHIHHPRDAKRTTDELAEIRMQQAMRMVQLIAELMGH